MSTSTHNLVEYLKGFVVDERRQLFESKIQDRTKHITIVLENIQTITGPKSVLILSTK